MCQVLYTTTVDSRTVHVPIGMYSRQLLQGIGTCESIWICKRLSADVCVHVCMPGYGHCGGSFIPYLMMMMMGVGGFNF